MTYKQIEAARETRLWITNIVVPVTTTALFICNANPKIMEKITDKYEEIKHDIYIKKARRNINRVK